MPNRAKIAYPVENSLTVALTIANMAIKLTAKKTQYKYRCWLKCIGSTEDLI